MPAQSPKKIAGKRFRLKNWDGVKDVTIGNAYPAAREKGNAHVTGQGVDSDDSGFNDVEERRKRFGFLY
jgi:hypothetical protein